MKPAVKPANKDCVRNQYRLNLLEQEIKVLEGQKHNCEAMIPDAATDYGRLSELEKEKMRLEAAYKKE